MLLLKMWLVEGDGFFQVCVFLYTFVSLFICPVFPCIVKAIVLLL